MIAPRKYNGLTPGGLAEKAIEIVASHGSIVGPLLAARLGVRHGDMSAPLMRAIALGYLTKARTEGVRNTVTYRLGKMAEGIDHAQPADLPVAPLLPPRQSRRGRVLSALLAHGSWMAESDLLDAHGRDGKHAHTWRKNSYEPLLASGLIFQSGNSKGELRWCLSDAGAELLSTCPQEYLLEPEAPPVLVPPRTAPAWKALDISVLGATPQRAGAWDFKAIPSHFAQLNEGR